LIRARAKRALQRDPRSRLQRKEVCNNWERLKLKAIAKLLISDSSPLRVKADYPYAAWVAFMTRYFKVRTGIENISF
jgi:hypothetical protein